MKLAEMIDAFIATVCAGKTNETPIAYRSKLRHLEKFLGSDYEGIGQDDIDRFKIYLLERKTRIRGGKEVKGGLSKFTIRSVLGTTKIFVDWLTKTGRLSQKIELRNIKEPRPDPKAIDPENIERLLLAAKSTGEDWEQVRNLAILYTLRDTGSRVGAMARMDVESINLKDGTAMVMDKGESISTLWFTEPTIEAIRQWLSVRAGLCPGDYRLWTGASGFGLSRIGIYRVLERLAKIAGVTGRHNPHSFRHAFARDTLMDGADLGQVSQMMNHSSAVVTDKYYARWTKLELKKFHTLYSPGRKLPKPQKSTRKEGSAKP